MRVKRGFDSRAFAAASCHSLALLIALGIQHMNSPLAGAWLFFHFAGCGLMAFDGRPFFPAYINALLLAWLAALGVSTFILAPVTNGAAFMWSLSAMPMLALCMKPRYLRSYSVGFSAILGLYAIVLVGQFALGVHYKTPGLTYHWFDFDHELLVAAAWPLLDPNNAACVMNFLFIPVAYFTFKNWKWTPVFLIVAASLVVTASKAGIAAACAACAALLISRYGMKAVLVACAACAALLFFGWPYVTHSVDTRLPIWTAAASLLDIAPFRGVGLGMFGHYYAGVRTEHITGGWFAHDDFLQIAIEMGIPAAGIFSLLWVEVFNGVYKRSLLPACVIGAVLLQSAVEFQFYLPVVSLLMGLTVACFKISSEESLDLKLR